MLEAKNLMVGDWVIRKGISQEPMQIAGFNTWKGLVYMDFTGLAITEKIENIEPIPLTEEIIKNNDFHFNGLAYIGSVIDLRKIHNSKLKVYGGIMEQDCDIILKNFFGKIR